MSGNVKCSIHGEHGLLADGKCWYCVQQGVLGSPTVPKSAPKSTENKVVLAYKEK